MGNKRTSERKSPVTVIEIVIIAILLVFIVIMIATCFAFRNKGDTPQIFGKYLYHTKAVNMLPKIPENTLIIADKDDISNIVPGSVVLCNIDENTILIRVTEVSIEEGNQYYVVKFDTSPENETFKISKDDIIAVAKQQDSVMGGIISFATTTYGVLLIIILPCFLIILFQVFKIVNIKRLEEKADALDDLDDIIFTNEQEEPSPVTFTKPVFKEDVTEEVPVLKVNTNGKADYSVRKEPQSPLYTAETTSTASREKTYANVPTRAEKPIQKSKVDDFFDTYRDSDFAKSVHTEPKPQQQEKVSTVYTPFISNVISDDIANVQDNVTEPVVKSKFNASLDAFYKKEDTKTAVPQKEQLEKQLENVDTIPQNAVLPDVNLAPPKRKKNNKTLDELMSIIDKEESKLKK